MYYGLSKRVINPALHTFAFHTINILGINWVVLWQQRFLLQEHVNHLHQKDLIHDMTNSGITLPSNIAIAGSAHLAIA